MSELQNMIWKVLLKETKMENLRPGDHIYTWTGANTKKHGIYLDDENVIHFSQGRRGARSDDHHSTCPKCRDRDQSNFHGVVCSCIDCFRSGGDHLYLFEYGVNPALILAKFGGGTTLALADPPEVVQNRASSFLLNNSNDSSSYYRFINNGKDFAMYCKTGLLVMDNINFSRSWQAAAFFLAVSVTFFLFLQQSTAATFTDAAATCFGLYCIHKFGSDIGARPNVIKVDQVETLPDFDKKLSSAASGFRPIQSLIDLFILLLMTLFNIQLLSRVRMWSEPLQLLSETPRVVWILACIILFYLAILKKMFKIQRLISNRIHQKQLKPGDHIYTWRCNSYSTYAYHGIYVGDSDGEVISLIRGVDPILPSSASSHSSYIPISTSSTASNQAKKSHVEYCSLDSFLNGDELYLCKYGVSLAFFVAKILGGTCTLCSTDRPETVVYRSRRELNKGFGTGAYNLFNNSCEDFAIYCKTGLCSRNIIINLGRQIASYLGMLCAIAIFKFTFRPSNPIGVAATVYFIYSMFRFVADATHCRKAYEVRLKILPSWMHNCHFSIVPQLMHHEGENLLL
ncbi:uncharacterized protein LOC107415719 isoform X2 [Ziziphus jujuba]|uniref:Uncharacterized protein LOC107415719 isoform X2 n=1 Tax=Ziziphus jujuba TaxID=326968 RepID=A0ABM3IFJ8_ZIZJJ|nr:uncharacterized protein LOC107415719 isoform X2 [Ziziphus jujuba]